MWASGVIAVASSPPVLTDRGEYNSWDYQIGDLTCNSLFHDMDLSAIVGAAARLVCIRLQWASNNDGDSFEFRTKYGASVKNEAARRTQGSPATQEADIYVITDPDGIVEYSFLTGAFTTVRICIRHWWSIP